MEVDNVADKEVDKVAARVADMVDDKNKINLVRELVTGSVNWAQTFSTRSLRNAHLLSCVSLFKVFV